MRVMLGGGDLRIRLIIVLVILCSHFVIDTTATRCIAKDSCDADCGICDKLESLDSCTKIDFCDLTAACEPAPGCSWFNNATCTVTSVASVTTSEQQQELCALTTSSSVCADMKFCEWKDDCRECYNFTLNRDCVKRDFCAWDWGTLPAYPVTSADVVFVVASLMCEMYTTFRLLKVRFLSVLLSTRFVQCRAMVGLDTCY
jgi:hypothetical protein